MATQALDSAADNDRATPLTYSTKILVLLAAILLFHRGGRRCRQRRSFALTTRQLRSKWTDPTVVCTASTMYRVSGANQRRAS